MLIWSQILPRLNWRYSNNLAVMDKCRRRLNSPIGAHITRNLAIAMQTKWSVPITLSNYQLHIKHSHLDK
jgi:hypothetical protein